MSNQSAILRKNRALLATANGQAATPGDVAAALGRVSHLAAKYGITHAQIETAIAEDGSATVSIRGKGVIRRKAWKARRVSRWNRRLLEAAATSTGSLLRLA